MCRGGLYKRFHCTLVPPLGDCRKGPVEVICSNTTVLNNISLCFLWIRCIKSDLCQPLHRMRFCIMLEAYLRGCGEDMLVSTFNGEHFNVEYISIASTSKQQKTFLILCTYCTNKLRKLSNIIVYIGSIHHFHCYATIDHIIITMLVETSQTQNQCYSA